MTDDFDEIYNRNEGELLLDRLRQAEKASPTEVVFVDELFLRERWPASKEELSAFPNITYSNADFWGWCMNNDLARWKIVVSERTNSEHHNLSNGKKNFRYMALKRYPRTPQ